MIPTSEVDDGWLRRLRFACFSFAWRRFLTGILVALVCGSNRSLAAELVFKEVQLPPLRILGQSAEAHTQGMEFSGGNIFVSARRDDVRPKRALLLRTGAAAQDWDVWDITPLNSQDVATPLDHPGGMQSDGTRLWIPLAESRRTGRSIIRAFPLKDFEAGRLLKADLEFSVNDHIGAVAVSAEHQLLLGANWDTEKVYLWNLKGHLRRILRGTELKPRQLGVQVGSEARVGVAVQDWKWVGDRLFASGLFRSFGSVAGSTESRLICFTNILEADFQQWTVRLPLLNGIQLAREAMAISTAEVLLLPEDLGATNRMFRISIEDLTKRGVAGSSNTIER